MGALAITGFVFALWAKHFLLAIYALPINFSNLTLIIGFANSTCTMLIAGLIMIGVLMPVYKKRTTSFNPKGLGAALISAGLYSIIFLAISLFNIEYSRWIGLIDWWTIVLLVLGAGFLILKKSKEYDTQTGNLPVSQSKKQNS